MIQGFFVLVIGKIELLLIKKGKIFESGDEMCTRNQDFYIGHVEFERLIKHQSGEFEYSVLPTLKIK